MESTPSPLNCFLSGRCCLATEVKLKPPASHKHNKYLSMSAPEPKALFHCMVVEFLTVTLAGCFDPGPS